MVVKELHSVRVYAHENDLLDLSEGIETVLNALKDHKYTDVYEYISYLLIFVVPEIEDTPDGYAVAYWVEEILKIFLIEMDDVHKPVQQT